MRRRWLAPVIAGALALGIVVGAAGTIVAHPAASGGEMPMMADHLSDQDWAAMAEMMAEHMADPAMIAMMADHMSDPAMAAMHGNMPDMPVDGADHAAHHAPMNSMVP